MYKFAFVLLVHCYSPVFDGLFDFCSMYTGASLEAAYKLNNEVRSCTVLNCQSQLYLTPNKNRDARAFFLSPLLVMIKKFPWLTWLDLRIN